MTIEELATRWTIRLAMACYALALLLRLRQPNRRVYSLVARVVWTLGFVLFVVHVVCAFAFFHHWSHAEAVTATARQTEELLGVAFGGGVFANYVFLLLWGIDVVWWWAGLDVYERRPRWATIAIHCYLAFIAFNATVVFVAGPVRWISLAVAGILALAWAERSVPTNDA